MAKSLADLLSGEKLNQDEIRELYEEAMGKIRGANALLIIVREQLNILRTRCSHPRKTSNNCLDCGTDLSSD